jgi:uncharacterized FlaG/YvyC family protein
MSFDIPPVASANPVSATERTGTNQAPAPRASEPSVSVDTVPASPPPEVHAAIAVASQAHERLAAHDRALHFHVDERSGKLQVEVQDLNGNVLFTVPPSKALEIAAVGS